MTLEDHCNILTTEVDTAFTHGRGQCYVDCPVYSKEIQEFGR